MPDGCTDGCTGEPAESDSAGANAIDSPNPAPTAEHFAEAVAMLARLPLTDAERAEAVRRLLGGECIVSVRGPVAHTDRWGQHTGG